MAIEKGNRFVPGLPPAEALNATKRAKHARKKTTKALPLVQPPSISSSPPHSKVAPPPELPPSSLTRVLPSNPLPPKIASEKRPPTKCSTKKRSPSKSRPPKQFHLKRPSVNKSPSSRKEPRKVKNLLPGKQIEFQQPDKQCDVTWLPRAAATFSTSLPFKPVTQVLCFLGSP